MMFYDVIILLLSIYRNSYKAVMNNGELVEVKNGYLLVTHNIVTNNGQVAPLKTHSDTHSVYTCSPQPNQDHNTAINLVKRVPEKI